MSWQWLVMPLAVALIYGGIAIFRKTIPTWRLAIAAQHWPTTTGRIMRSEVVRTGSGRAISYKPLISYEYAAGGYIHYSEQRSFAPELSGAEHAAAFHCAKYTAGESITVHYDPANPVQAVLEAPLTSVDLYLLSCLLAAALLIVGGILAAITVASIF